MADLTDKPDRPSSIPLRPVTDPAADGISRRMALQTHDIDNLYVMDASSFVSGGCQNPTLTIMALAVRGCDHLMAEMKRGNI